MLHGVIVLGMGLHYMSHKIRKERQRSQRLEPRRDTRRLAGRKVSQTRDYLFVLFEKLLDMPRNMKQALLLVMDMVFIPLALLGALLLRYGQQDFSVGVNELIVCVITIGFTAAAFLRLGLYRAVIRFMGHQALMAIIKGVSFSAGMVAITLFFMQLPLPRSVPFIYWCLMMLTVGGSRLLVRAYYQHIVGLRSQKVVIYGAGSSGRQLHTALMHSDDHRVLFFVDDDKSLQGRIINGILVQKPSNLPKLIKDHGITQVLLAMPVISHRRRREIINRLVGLPVYVRTVPAFTDLVRGQAQVEEIQDIEIDDLLGRDPLPPRPELLCQCIADKVVMVTGAGGSIGSELCRQIIRSRPSELLLLDISEFALYNVEKELREEAERDGIQLHCVPLLGNVQDETLMVELYQTFGVQTVYHAAAYKHVPLVEYNMAGGVRNNVFGTQVAAEKAVECGVETFVLISTDKAVRPTNVMGASKRVAELICQALAEKQSKTRFCMVRFGNVLGSSGSVVPLFREQIKSGGPVTVTHKDIIRYFMTIPEAAQLVLQAGAMGRGGDVFVLDMGEPIRIMDLAKRMIRLMGYEVRDGDNPHGDIDIVVTGLRPGEKLYEELLVGDNVSGTGHPMIRRAEEEGMDHRRLMEHLQALRSACDSMDCDRMHEELFSVICEFRSNSGVTDKLWLKKSRQHRDVSNVQPLFPNQSIPGQ